MSGRIIRNKTKAAEFLFVNATSNNKVYPVQKCVYYSYTHHIITIVGNFNSEKRKKKTVRHYEQTLLQLFRLQAYSRRVLIKKCKFGEEKHSYPLLPVHSVLTF